MRSTLPRLVWVAVILLALALPSAAQAQGVGIIRISPGGTVVVPDGGTATISGVTQISESRSQFGAPVLAQVPVVNRAFGNVGYGRTMVVGRVTASVRIIDLREEEFRQTGYRDR